MSRKRVECDEGAMGEGEVRAALVGGPPWEVAKRNTTEQFDH